MKRLTITDLRMDQCRFPITPDDAPRHFFCGERVMEPGCPYCAEHAARCFDGRPEERRAAHAARMALARAARKSAAGSVPFDRRPSASPKF